MVELPLKADWSSEDPRLAPDFSAIYAPVRTDDLTPGAREMIGRMYMWRPLWIIQDGPYAGQWALENRGVRPWGWSPQCDLSPVAPAK